MARRAMNKKEKRMMQRIFKLQSPPPLKNLEIIQKLGILDLLNYQFHLIVRIDDTTQETIDNFLFMINSQFS
jgi:hypothetical protein